ncbi:MAG: heme NO-binding domain-containing protein [Pseudomonadota bacterium]
MHGLVLKAVQLFVTDCYGAAKWVELCAVAGFDFDDFEPMLMYDRATGDTTLTALEQVMRRPVAEVCEDIGTYLASHPNTEGLRRLLRFGGANLEEFLHSLDELPDRVRLAMPDLILPRIELREHSFHSFSLTCYGDIPGFGHVLAGLVRTMIDDYGALAMVEHGGGGQGIETVLITLLERSFTEGRDFELWGDAA